MNHKEAIDIIKGNNLKNLSCAQSKESYDFFLFTTEKGKRKFYKNKKVDKKLSIEFTLYSDKENKYYPVHLCFFEDEIILDIPPRYTLFKEYVIDFEDVVSVITSKNPEKEFMTFLNNRILEEELRTDLKNANNKEVKI